MARRSSGELSRRELLAGAAASPAALQAQTVKSDRLNLIHINVDTWATHWMGCYGHHQIETPNVDRLAAKCALFEDAYPEVLPTICARRAIYTGRRIFPSDLIQQPDDQVKIRGWHQLYAEDVTISETLRGAGYTTAIVSDVYHQFKPDKNFHRGFDSWQWIRGQEQDRLVTGPRKGIDLNRYYHASQRGAPHDRRSILQYLLNRRQWKTEDDWLAARVFSHAAHWLTDNTAENQPFYLHIESFSPHEYWDPPEDYYRRYMKKNYDGPRLISPPQTTAQMTPLEVEHVRALYAGLAAFVDSRIGRFLDTVNALGLMRNTVIVLVADHGTMMGEQNQLHKGELRLRTQVTHVPLMIYHPSDDWSGRKIGGFVQHTDLMPTLLDILGVKAPGRVTGESLRPLIAANARSKREEIITGWGEHGSVRNQEWNYIGRWSPGKPFEELYNLRKDPLELHNVADEHPAELKEYRTRLRHHVDSGWSITRGTFALKLA